MPVTEPGAKCSAILQCAVIYELKRKSPHADRRVGFFMARFVKRKVKFVQAEMEFGQGLLPHSAPKCPLRGAFYLG